MPSIHVPKSAEPLLCFCRKSQDLADNACFETYAEMVIFAASLGFKLAEGRKPKGQVEDTKKVNPIDLDTFKNQGLFQNVLMMALATEKSQEIIRNEDQICRLIEGFAHQGFSEMEAILNKATDTTFHIELAKLLQKTAKEHLSEREP
jgi:dnd system-associated protein 4